MRLIRDVVASHGNIAVVETRCRCRGIVQNRCQITDTQSRRRTRLVYPPRTQTLSSSTETRSILVFQHLYTSVTLSEPLPLNREPEHPPVYDQRPGIGPRGGIAGDRRLQRLLQIKASGVVTWRWSVRKPRTVQHDRFVGLFVKESRNETRKRWTRTKVCR
jgi:hypothetical protein